MSASLPRWTTLVDAPALADALRDPSPRSGMPGTAAPDTTAPLRVVDCRFALNDTAAGETAWRAARIPGAVYAHLDRDLSGAKAPGAGRHPWPQAADFACWCAAQGIGADTQVVAYDAGDGAFASRLWWLLRSAGHTRVAVLDGGWARWHALGLPVDNSPVDSSSLDSMPHERMPPTAANPAARITPVSFDHTRLRDADAVRAALAQGALLIDARAPERFRGEVEPIDRVAGHVPGAVNRPYAANLQDGRFKPAEALAAEFAALLDGRGPEQAIAMCGSGVTACHHLLAMAHAGLDGAALYTGSWSGWIDSDARPVATGAE
jgi:thiosulfate/3-mercaptopyruvate sulfurtransferase